MDQEVKSFLESPQYEDKEISLLDLLLVLVRNKWLIGKIVGGCLAVGLLIAIFASSKYTASAQVIRETEAESRTGLSGLAMLQGLGINLGGATVGLTVDTYPDILKSREVRLAVARDQFYFRNMDAVMPFVDYYNRPRNFIIRALGFTKRHTIGLPGTLRRLSRGKNPASVFVDSVGRYVFPTEEEDKAIKAVAEMVTVKVARATSIMTVSVTTKDPLLSAALAASFVNHLALRVQAIYTQKTQENLEFIQDRFSEARGELEQAEEELARFMDQNRNPQTAQLQTEVERLRRKVTFKTELYSDLQTQLTQAEIELQRSRPVITLLEESVPPLKPGGPNRKLIVLLALFIGGIAGILSAYSREYFENLRTDEETGPKLKEIGQALVPRRWKRTDTKNSQLER